MKSFQVSKGLLVPISLGVCFGLTTFFLIGQQSVRAASAASISVIPATGTFALGQPFTVDIVLDGGGSAFNAAQANVGVSSSLKVQSLTTDNCNLTYIPQSGPDTSNVPGGSLDFAGAIFGSSSTNCKVYTLTLVPQINGTGGVSLTNGSVRSAADSSEMLPLDGSGLNSGVYTLGSGVSSPSPSISPSLSPSPSSSASASPTERPTDNGRNGNNNGNNNNNNNGGGGGGGGRSSSNASGDLDGDGKVDIFDLSVMLRQWGRGGSADLNRDGVVDIFDLSILLRNWTR